MTRVALFPTCLVDLTAPDVGYAVMDVLAHYGVRAEIAEGAFCCAQPAFNSGYVDEARAIADKTTRALTAYDAVVAPSGSCAAMLRMEVPGLVSPSLRADARRNAEHTFELVDYLMTERRISTAQGRFPHRVIVHGSCHNTRWLGHRGQLETLLSGLEGIELLSFPHPHTCCGFGGTFSVHFPELSLAMGDTKLESIDAQHADVLVSGDMGCLHHLGGRLRALGRPVRSLHVAQLLVEAMEVRAHGA